VGEDPTCITRNSKPVKRFVMGERKVHLHLRELICQYGLKKCGGKRQCSCSISNLRTRETTAARKNQEVLILIKVPEAGGVASLQRTLSTAQKRGKVHSSFGP